MMSNRSGHDGGGTDTDDDLEVIEVSSVGDKEAEDAWRAFSADSDNEMCSRPNRFVDKYDNDRIEICINDLSEKNPNKGEYMYSVRPNSSINKLLEAHVKRMNTGSISALTFLDREGCELVENCATVHESGLKEGDPLFAFPTSMEGEDGFQERLQGIIASQHESDEINGRNYCYSPY